MGTDPREKRTLGKPTGGKNGRWEKRTVRPLSYPSTSPLHPFSLSPALYPSHSLPSHYRYTLPLLYPILPIHTPPGRMNGRAFAAPSSGSLQQNLKEQEHGAC